MNSTLKSLLLNCDHETIEHCSRVAHLAVQFGLSIGLVERDLHVLRQGALLHDIGKQKIPEAILLKKGPLTAQEFEIIKTHPRNGYDLLKNMEVDLEILHIVLHHHERMDGQGYPQGLTGGNIPRMARLLAIVDAYDTMVFDRVYRQALGHEKALSEIDENMGTQFDMEFGRMFLQVYAEGV